MVIAVITVFHKERFRVDDWKRYYAEYRDDVSLHVIVNNGDPEDDAYLQEAFPSSRVLFCPSSSLMVAYNQGLREVLAHPEVDAVAQVGNDIRIEAGGLKVLYDYLFSDDDLAMVAPVLLRKDSDVVDCFGCRVNLRNLDFVHLDAGAHLDGQAPSDRMVTGLPGGMFLARRDRYEAFGFQDENLVMYADEIERSLKVLSLGWKMGATSRVRSWHQHVNPGGKVQRSPRAAFLMGRNPVLIARKHLSGGTAFRVFLRRLFVGLDEVRSALMHGKGRDHHRFGWALVKGAFAGLFQRIR